MSEKVKCEQRERLLCTEMAGRQFTQTLPLDANKSSLNQSQEGNEELEEQDAEEGQRALSIWGCFLSRDGY